MNECEEVEHTLSLTRPTLVNGTSFNTRLVDKQIYANLAKALPLKYMLSRLLKAVAFTSSAPVKVTRRTSDLKLTTEILLYFILGNSRNPIQICSREGCRGTRFDRHPTDVGRKAAFHKSPLIRNDGSHQPFGGTPHSDRSPNRGGCSGFEGLNMVRERKHQL